MAQSPLCTCCAPRTYLQPAYEDTAEPRWRCTSTGTPYAVRDGTVVALATLEPVLAASWDTTETPWDDSAGPTPTRVTQIDLSRFGYA